MKDNREKNIAKAHEVFATHKATIIQDDENFFVMDWRRSNGSGADFIRYILDIKRGAFIISGDRGDAIACWYNEVTPDKLYAYVNSVDYFMEKLQATKYKYTYTMENAEADLDEIKRSYLEDSCFSEEKIEEDFEEMRSLLQDGLYHTGIHYSEDLTNLMSKYAPEWWESDFEDIGRRISSNLYLWTEGYRMAYKEVCDERKSGKN